MSTPAGGPGVRERYGRAERYLRWNVPQLVSRTDVHPRWTGSGSHLWYRVRTPQGWEVVLVDPRRRTREPAFDHERLAAALGRSGALHPPGDLPVDDLEVVDGAVEVAVAGHRYRCERRTGEVRHLGPGTAPDELASPDGRWSVSVRGADLWLHDLRTGGRRPLTADGEPHHGYGTRPEFCLVDGTPDAAVLPPAAVWSPDSRYLLTHRLDERPVQEMHMIQAVPADGSRRPRLVTVRSAVAGDEHVPLVSPLVVDVETGARVAVAGPPIPAAAFSPVDLGQWWWGADGRVWIIRTDRGDRTAELLRVDRATGASEVVLTETSPTYVDLAPARWPPGVRVLDGSGDVLWWSERDGWGHLHLFDASGRLRRRLTRGEWVVRELVHVDEPGGRVLFTASGREPGRDPYLRHLYRVPLAGGEPELLTPEVADHAVCTSPDGRFVLDSSSSLDGGTTTVLRAADGEVLMTLEESDTAPLRALGWRPPEQVTVTARDGVTDLFGVVVVPADFDPAASYPVVDLVYPGSHRIHAPKRLSLERPDSSLWDAQALAELGFVVVLLDGLGTAFRSKAFHDGVLGSRFGEGGGLQDHVGGIRQLAADRPWMDLTRVGIVGGSWGGYWAARGVLCHGDFFSVAVAASGNHDPWRDNAWFAERYLGSPDTDRRPEHANSTFADRLAGHLLLVQGELEAHHCNPAYTLELVRALVAADKDVDLVVVPDAGHEEACGNHPYVARRTWDHLVTHLRGEVPPRGYRITGPTRAHDGG